MHAGKSHAFFMRVASTRMCVYAMHTWQRISVMGNHSFLSPSSLSSSCYVVYLLFTYIYICKLTKGDNYISLVAPAAFIYLPSTNSHLTNVRLGTHLLYQHNFGVAESIKHNASIIRR